MRKTISVVVCLTLALTTVSFSMAVSVNDTIYVDDDGGADYRSIQEAIDIAVDGDTIFVYSGNYSSIFVDEKDLVLIGEDKKNTIIDGQSHVACYFYKTSSEIKNFTIQNGGNHGFKLIGGNSNIISNNILKSNDVGIYIYDSRNNVIKNNIIKDNKETGISISGVINSVIENNEIINTTGGTGLRIDHVNNMIIRENNIINHKIGLEVLDCLVALWLFPSQQNRIMNNNFFNNTIHAGVKNRNGAYGSSFLCVRFLHNYWGRIKWTPKIIYKLDLYDNQIYFPCNIDLFPALSPINN